jgi:hypothetical protein
MDLNEMLRNHLAESEPGQVMFPDEALARGRRTVRIRRATVGVACAAVLAAGAAVAAPQLGSPDSQQGPASTEVTFESPIMEVLAGDRSWVDWQYAARLNDVEDTNACLADLGLTQREPLPDRGAIEREALDLRYNTVIHDDAFRAEHGYGLVDGALDKRYAEDRAWTKGLPDRALVCLEPQVDGELADITGLWSENALGVQSQVSRDPRIVAAVADWEECMAAAGHEFTDPTDPSGHMNPWNWVNRQHDTVSGAEAKAALAVREVEIAEADWACRTAGLNAVYDEVRIELEQKYVAGHPAEAAEARAAAEQLLGD